ncbi:hypothetical protein CGQ40_21495 (plasmid) [Clostridium botulinum]|nr:hypothetical protein CGQ40_21495 [Clostridium botulinum]
MKKNSRISKKAGEKMNIYQKHLNKAVIENIKLYPGLGNGSFYKRRKLFRKLVKLQLKRELDLLDIKD